MARNIGMKLNLAAGKIIVCDQILFHQRLISVLKNSMEVVSELLRMLIANIKPANIH